MSTGSSIEISRIDHQSHAPSHGSTNQVRHVFLVPIATTNCVKICAAYLAAMGNGITNAKDVRRSEAGDVNTTAAPKRQKDGAWLVLATYLLFDIPL